MSAEAQRGARHLKGVVRFLMRNRKAFGRGSRSITALRERRLLPLSVVDLEMDWSEEAESASLVGEMVSPPRDAPQDVPPWTTGALESAVDAATMVERADDDGCGAGAEAQARDAHLSWPPVSEGGPGSPRASLPVPIPAEVRTRRFHQAAHPCPLF